MDCAAQNKTAIEIQVTAISFLDEGIEYVLEIRQQSPSPLHRHPQSNMHYSTARAKGDISSLPGTRHFYFALTPRQSGLTISGA